MIRCEGDESRALVHLWDPSWQAPTVVDFAAQIPGGKILGKTIARWLNVDTQYPAVFFSDSQGCVLASVSEPGTKEEVPWMDAHVKEFDIYGNQEESPLNLVPADEKVRFRRMTVDVTDEGMTGMSGGSEEVDDTFRFKKFIEPR